MRCECLSYLCWNLLVLTSFWRSSACLRSKFFDFLMLISNHPILILCLVLSLNEKNDPHVLALVQHFPTCLLDFQSWLLLCIEHRLQDKNCQHSCGTVSPDDYFDDNFCEPLGSLLCGGFENFFLIMFRSLAFLNRKLFMISKKLGRTIENCRNNTSTSWTLRFDLTFQPVCSQLAFIWLRFFSDFLHFLQLC